VDLFSDRQGGVLAAAGQVEAALRAAGLVVERRDQFEDLADIFPGMGRGWLNGPSLVLAVSR
jgi:hypothetical protein